MKFYTNKISTGKPANFGDFVTKLANSNASLNKTASTETVTKEAETKKANIANLGDKKAPPFGKKDEKKEEKKDKESCETNCESSAEAEVKIAGEDRKPDKDGEVHVEMQEMDPVGGTNTGKPEGEKKKESGAKTEVKEAGKKAPVKAPIKAPAKTAPAKKASNDEIPAENKGVTHQTDECCGAPTSKGDDGSEGKKSEGKKSGEDKEASANKSNTNFVRIANLDAKTKSEWKTYWKKLYPTEYVEALFADK